MWKYVKAVAIRELRIWAQRPIYFVGSLGVILFGSIFFLTFFRSILFGWSILRCFFIGPSLLERAFDKPNTYACYCKQ